MKNKNWNLLDIPKHAWQKICLFLIWGLFLLFGFDFNIKILVVSSLGLFLWGIMNFFVFQGGSFKYKELCRAIFWADTNTNFIYELSKKNNSDDLFPILEDACSEGLTLLEEESKNNKNNYEKRI